MPTKYRKPARSASKKSPRTRSEVTSDGEHVQMVLPIAEILAAAREGLESVIGEIGVMVIDGLIQDEVTQIVGKPHQRGLERTAYRWGREQGYVSFAGQKIPLVRPRASGGWADGMVGRLRQYDTGTHTHELAPHARLSGDSRATA